MPDDENVLLAVMGGRIRVLGYAVDPNYPMVAFFQQRATSSVVGYSVNEGDYTAANTETVKGLIQLYGTIDWSAPDGTEKVIIGNHEVPFSEFSWLSDNDYFEKFGFVEGQLQVLITGNEVNGYVKNGRFYACITDYDPEISDNRCLSGIYKHGSVPLASLDSMLTNANDKLYGASLRGSWSPAESALHAALPLEVVGTVIDYGDDGDPGEQLPLLRYSVDL